MIIKWCSPYKVPQGYQRRWSIPNNYVDGFFLFWNKNKFSLLTDGFVLSKTKTGNNWYLTETKPSISLFRSFDKSSSQPVIEEPPFELPPYQLKDTSGLRPWQVKSVSKLVSSINYWGAAVDGSETGSGKTFSACAVAREFGNNVVVICPKAVITTWKRVLTNHFKMEDKVIGVVNYERLRIGNEDSPIASYVLSRKDNRHVFTWKIPKNTLIIWDESQKLKNWKTQNAKICYTAIKEGFPMLFCSATLATNPLEMRAIGLAIKLFKGGNKDYYKWAKENGIVDGDWGLEFNNDSRVLKKLHTAVFSHRGVRLRRDDIPNFPSCEIIPELYNMEESDVKHVNKIYDDMDKELKKLEERSKDDEESELIIRLRARQSVELLKVPRIVEMAEEGLEEGFSIAIFVNFTDTLNAIAERLKTDCIYDGNISDKLKDEHVDNFQNNTSRIILINIGSGGAGLSLHDLHGGHPRESIISPNDSAVLMRQCVGRIWRDGAKTKAIQKILLAANTVEEAVYDNFNRKLDNLDLLNDGDLSCSKNKRSKSLIKV